MCSILGWCGKGGSEEKVKEALSKTISRGPDDSRIINTGNGWLGFNRLSIMGPAPEGMQPFAYGDHKTLNGSGHESSAEVFVVCNGEIYGFRKIKECLLKKGYTFMSDSDCEILPAMYEEYGCECFKMLDAEYALVFYDARNDSYIAARDPIGIRPLYYTVVDGEYVFASEPKNLTMLKTKIMPFPPGHYFKDGKFICYRDMSDVKEYVKTDIDTVTKNIHDLLIKGVEKRLDADVPVGFLLSGGLDSSLVCGIAASISDRPIKTWAIGMDIDAIDLKYAKEVADFIKKNRSTDIENICNFINSFWRRKTFTSFHASNCNLWIYKSS